jgi:hypothetical protein
LLSVSIRSPSPIMPYFRGAGFRSGFEQCCDLARQAGGVRLSGRVDGGFLGLPGPVRCRERASQRGVVFFISARCLFVNESVNDRKVPKPAGSGPLSSKLCSCPFTNSWKTCFVVGSHQLTYPPSRT